MKKNILEYLLKLIICYLAIIGIVSFFEKDPPPTIEGINIEVYKIGYKKALLNIYNNVNCIEGKDLFMVGNLMEKGIIELQEAKYEKL